MTSKTFSPGVVIDSPWLNDVNDTVYDVLGDGISIPATKAAARINLGLGNVDNTSDANKPISTATQAAITATNAAVALRATIASPVLTGDPRAPTPSAGDNDTSIATTAFVQTALKAFPSFHVYRTGAQSFTSGTTTPVIFDTATWDSNSFYSTSTGRFTPTVAGYYRFSVRIRVSGSLTEVTVNLRKNGVVFAEGGTVTPVTSAAQGSIVSVLIQLNGTTDYVDSSVFVATSSGTGALTPGQAQAYFCGELVAST